MRRNHKKLLEIIGLLGYIKALLRLSRTKEARSETAWVCGLSCHTVRKWRGRFFTEKELVQKGVPLYQFTALDIRTRIRFLAHRQEKSFSNGWAFIVFVVLWLRSLGIKVKITIRTDWGDDGKKIAWMNQQLARLGRKLPASIKAVKKKMVMLNKATGLTKRLCRNSAQILRYSLL